MEKIKNILSKIKTFALGHKILSGFILIVIIASPFVINYFLPQKTTINYVTQLVKKGNISVSISGTGQVSSLDEVTLTSEVSGDITGVYTENGVEVNKGELLFKIDSSEGEKNLKSAELALESAELALEEMQEPVDELTLLQAENSLIEAEESKTKAESNLEKAYDDGFTDVSNAFLDLPSVVTGIYDVLFSETASSNGSQDNIDFYTTAINYCNENGTKYRDDVYNKYIAAKAKYDAVLIEYKVASRYSDKETIESLITETYNAAKAIAESIKSSTDFIEYYKYVMSEEQQSYSSIATANTSSLSNYSSKINNHLSNLLSAKSTIEDSKDSIVSADRSIKVKELSLEKTKEGSTDLEIRIQQLAVEQKEADLADAENTLSKYSIRAPFSGIIASVSVSKGDAAGTQTTMGSIITHEKIATITLNEVDIAKVKVGQKVDITFDALDDVIVQGEVYEVDAVGTVSQGVVSYSVKISFETDNESVKPGMSISANVIIESVADVLTTASSAVKTMGDKSFVEVMTSDGKIERKVVEVGITDDASIEIKSGLAEGDKVVTSTNTGTTKKTTTTNNQSTTRTLNSITNTDGPPSGGMGPGM
jgi:RND family efflux transporter MFP subunit